MAKNKGKRISAEFKAQVALEAAKGAKTASEIASEYQVHPTQISQWKRQLLDGSPELFQTPRSQKEPTAEELTAAQFRRSKRLRGGAVRRTPRRFTKRSAGSRSS